MAPIVAALGFAARIGCGFTSRLGAMRISEEIDALESMAIRPIPYLVTTRLLAGSVLVLPLYLIGLVGTYMATDLMVTVFFDQSHGTYQHYFQAFVSPVDVLYSAIKVVVLTSVVTLIHCYFGFTAERRARGRRQGHRPGDPHQHHRDHGPRHHHDADALGRGPAGRDLGMSQHAAPYADPWGSRPTASGCSSWRHGRGAVRGVRRLDRARPTSARSAAASG